MRYVLIAVLLALAPPVAAQQEASEAQGATDEYTELVKRVQIALHLHGFDPGPVNGRDEGPTQAALAKFQLANNLPASGSMDEATLKQLGVSRDQAPQEEENASAGAGMPIAKP